MWLICLLLFSVVFIIITTSKLNWHPFLSLLDAAFGFGAFSGTMSLEEVVKSINSGFTKFRNRRSDQQQFVGRKKSGYPTSAYYCCRTKNSPGFGHSCDHYRCRHYGTTVGYFGNGFQSCPCFSGCCSWFRRNDRKPCQRQLFLGRYTNVGHECQPGL